MNEMADLLAPYWSERRTREALNVDEDRLAQMCRDGKVLGLPSTDGETFFPVWTLERKDGQVRTNVRLRPFISTLRSVDPWTVGILLRTPADELDGLTPEQWARERRDQAVLDRLAHRLLAEMRQ